MCSDFRLSRKKKILAQKKSTRRQKQDHLLGATTTFKIQKQDHLPGNVDLQLHLKMPAVNDDAYGCSPDSGSR